MIFVDVKLADGATLPQYKTSGASGVDLVARGLVSGAALQVGTPVGIGPGQSRRFCTGIALAIPVGYEGQIRSRSSLARRGLIVPIGTIDSDYRGELIVVVWNLGRDVEAIAIGDRIAQLVIAPVERAILRAVDALPDTDRGAGSFGSTGQ